MPEIIRSAKSGSDWTENELLAYNITVDAVPAAQFFGFDPGATPLDVVDAAFVTHVLGQDTNQLTRETRRLLGYLKLAYTANTGQESAINDFARELLRTLDFEPGDTLLRARYAIPFTISGDTKCAQTDLCLVDVGSVILLIVQQDKTVNSAKDPEPQLIAEAIAAFQANKRARTLLTLGRLDTMEFPCITMVGTRPTFYRIPSPPSSITPLSPPVIPPMSHVFSSVRFLRAP